MSREGIEAQLLARGVQTYEPVYTQTQVTVYKATFQGAPSAVKILYLPVNADQTQIEREFQALQTLKHPCIVNLLDCFWANNFNQYYFVLVLEWCDGDLDKEILLRQQQNRPWTESELWEITKNLIGAFSFMQERGCAHRDIKPANLFLSASQIKIGDFGSSKYLEREEMMATLTGSPLFLSPVLKQGLLKRSRNVQHNVYKSDVYSLGMTLLSLAILDTPFTLFSADFTDAGIWQVLCPLPYSDCFKVMLQGMMLQEEQERCDFLQMNKWVNKVFEPVKMPRAKSKGSLVAVEVKGEDKEEVEPPVAGAEKSCCHCCRPEDTNMQIIPLTCHHHALCLDCLQSLIDQMSINSKCPNCQLPLTNEVIETYRAKGSLLRRASSAIASKVTSAVQFIKSHIPFGGS